MLLDQESSPLKFKLSFRKLLEGYEGFEKSDSSFLVARFLELKSKKERFPELFDGSILENEIAGHLPEIKSILEGIFSPLLTLNEIKVATLPYTNMVLHSSERFQTIISNATNPFSLITEDFTSDQLYMMSCCTILYWYYGYDLQFKKPIYYKAKDKKGTSQKYRVLYNGDFMDIYPTELAKEITEEDVKLLLKGFNDMDLWKRLFPPGSWISEGFVIANMYDATVDTSLSDLKTSLLTINIDDENSKKTIEEQFRKFFNLQSLNLGFTLYDAKTSTMEKPLGINSRSYILGDRLSIEVSKMLCESSLKAIVSEKHFFVISDVDEYLQLEGGNNELSSFKSQGIQSAILVPIIRYGVLYGILELVSTEKYALNSVNAFKLTDIIPNLTISIIRTRQDIENRIEAIIQRECTSIHPSVYWRFEQEAKNYLQQQIQKGTPVFREIVFNDVYPLYGQTDIRNSSNNRNLAIQRDLIVQLSKIKEILEDMGLFEARQKFASSLSKVEAFIASILKELKSDSEQVVLSFIKKEIHPLLESVSQESISGELEKNIQTYFSSLDPETHSIYSHRKNFDETVTSINKALIDVLDHCQVGAQAMYPHFFDRYKTDGVEHDLYIGESITRIDSFKIEFLYNLRLWQLQVVCCMENAHRQIYNDLILKLEVTSMILVYSMPMGIRYRMDEKRFDVDGTYNVRYEVIKKRIDKALVKGTSERINKENHLSIIYSHRSDEEEYLEYVRFLQSKGYFGPTIEILELERQQGVSGLKAIRVEILYGMRFSERRVFTYDDFLAEKLSSQSIVESNSK